MQSLRGHLKPLQGAILEKQSRVVPKIGIEEPRNRPDMYSELADSGYPEAQRDQNHKQRDKMI